MVKKITRNAILIAFNVSVGLMIHIPIGREIFTPLMASVFICAFLLGKKQGMIIGGLSGLILNILLQLWLWAPVTLIVYSLMGYVAGLLGHHSKNNVSRLLAVLSCWVILVIGYLIGGSVMFGSIEIGLSGVILNIMQGAVSGAVALSVFPLIKNAMGYRLEKI